MEYTPLAKQLNNIRSSFSQRERTLSKLLGRPTRSPRDVISSIATCSCFTDPPVPSFLRPDDVGMDTLMLVGVGEFVRLFNICYSEGKETVKS